MTGIHKFQDQWGLIALKNTLADIENDLERAVFMAQYRSRRQRLIRYTGMLLIVAKHGLRGLLYVWPLVLLVFVDFPGAWDVIRLILILLASAAWSRFVYGSVRDDYQRFVAGRLLLPGSLRNVF
ncbi:MAG: hypothetical protein ACE5FQ_12675 [Thiogranum sp.]